MNIKDFDKIYVIHLSDRPDRLKVILPEFAKVGLLDKLDIRWTCRKNVYKRIASVLPEIGISLRYKDNIDIQAGVIGCTLNHYELIKTSYERGFDHIMIFENDVKFNCEDEKIFNLIISKIPDDYKICMLGWVEYSKTPSQLVLDDNTIYWLQVEAPTNWARGAYAYCISREGMKEIIRIFEEDNYFPCFDMCFDHWPTKEYKDLNGNIKNVLDGFYIINHIPLIDASWSPSAVILEDQHMFDRENDNPKKEE